MAEINLSIIKFGKVAKGFVKSMTDEYNIVCVADPDTNNIVSAQFTCDEVDTTLDFSDAVARKNVDAVFVTIADMAYGIILTALAYGKNVMVDSSVKYNNNLELLSRKLGLWIDWSAT